MNILRQAYLSVWSPSASQKKAGAGKHPAPVTVLRAQCRPAAARCRYFPSSLRSRRLRLISYPIAPSRVTVIRISASALIVGVMPLRR